MQTEAAALTLSPSANSQRQVQSRRFDTQDEPSLVDAAVGVLQDLDYTVEETSLAAGVITAIKDRGGSRIRVSLVVRRSSDGQAQVVRATFQAITAGGSETIGDAQIYQQFFDRLSQSVVLTGQNI